MRPRSVALLISAPAWRGSGASFGKIAAGLERAGHRALLITGAAEVTERLRELRLTVEQLVLPRTGWKEVSAVRQALGRFGAEIVLADTPRDLRLGAANALLRRRSLVFRYNLSGRDLPADPLSRLFWSRITAVVYQSEYARDRAYRTSPWLRQIPAHLIGNGYDGEVHRPDPAAADRARRRLSLPPERLVVVSGAALYFAKGYAVALHALARIADRLGVTYVICGAGPEQAAIEALARQLLVPAIFPGQLSPAEFRDALQAADVVLHAAPGELFPNLVGEAMASARAVVGVDSGATPEVVGRAGRAGCLVPPDDPAALADALERLLADRELRASMGREARDRILERFPLRQMEDAYVRLCESLP